MTFTNLSVLDDTVRWDNDLAQAAKVTGLLETGRWAAGLSEVPRQLTPRTRHREHRAISCLLLKNKINEKGQSSQVKVTQGHAKVPSTIIAGST